MIIPDGTNSTFDNKYMTAETAVRYYNEDVWEELVDSVTLEEAIEKPLWWVDELKDAGTNREKIKHCLDIVESCLTDDMDFKSFMG